MTDILPGAEPFSVVGGRAGALIIHGFTGTPQSMRPLAQAFADAGYTVEQPLLPGHGTTPEDMSRTGWADWYAAADAAYADLATRTDSVVVAGLSLGGALTLALGEAHPEIAGLVLVNPLVDTAPLAPMRDGAAQLLDAGEEFMTGIGNDVADPEVTELAYSQTPNRCVLDLFEAMPPVVAALGDLTVPVLLLHSEQDHVIPPSSADLLETTVTSPFERVELAQSFHVATIDLDKDEINRRALDFAAQVSA